MIFITEIIGIIAFAFSGATIAIKKDFDNKINISIFQIKITTYKGE